MKKLIILTIFIFLVFLTYFTNKALAIDYYSTYDTHPDFWSAGEEGYGYVGKKYFRLPGSPNTHGFDINEVWSGPLDQNSRYVVYQFYKTLDYDSSHSSDYPVYEWEKWTGDPINHIAYNHSYAGTTADNNRKAYSSQAICLSQPNNTGHPWPNFENGSTFTYVPESVFYGGECTTSWVDANHPGGYVASHLLETWSEPFTSLRNSKCDSYIPSRVTSDGNQICKSSPSVGIIYQEYVTGSRSSDSHFQHGCEATVYAWGYPFIPDDNYKKWFRNGELRFSDWYNMGAYVYAYAPDDHNWWDSSCSNAFTQVANWVYSGSYQFNSTNLYDHGDPAPIPTTTPTPTITPILPTVTPTPSPSPTPTPTPSYLPGDINHNGHVDIFDNSLLVEHFGTTGSPGWILEDVDPNGTIDIFDYNILVGNFGGKL